MIYGYSRVSTWRQGTEGNSLEDQNAKLKAAGAQEIVSDICTGTKMDRPELTKLLKKLREGDTLIVTKLDRFARTAVEGGQIVQDLFKKKVRIHILNMGICEDTTMGNLMLNVLLAFAQFERDMIVERTQTGKEIARANGVRVDGRPEKYSRKQMQHAMDLLNEHTYTEVSNMTGISKSTLIRAVRKQRASAQKVGAEA